MGVEILALLAGLVALIPVILSAMSKRKANRNDIGKVESAELDTAMQRVDKLFPAPKQD